jgi:hypothetical protein
MNKPVNIKVERLNPTEYKILSILSRLCNLRILRIIVPGINKRYIKQIICLNIGIFNPIKSKPIVPKNSNWNENTIIRNVLIGQSLILKGFLILIFIPNHKMLEFITTKII